MEGLGSVKKGIPPPRDQENKIIKSTTYKITLAFVSTFGQYNALSQFWVAERQWVREQFINFLGVLMLENLNVSEASKVVSLSANKSKKLTVKDLCKDEDIAMVFRLVCQHDLRKKAIEALEKKIFDIKSV